MAGHEETSARHQGATAPDEAGELTRRGFLTWTMGALGGVIGVSYLGMGLRFLWPPSSSSSKMEHVKLENGIPAKASDFKPNVPLLTIYTGEGIEGGVWVVNLKGTWVAYDQHCTHLQCPYTWAGQFFACPCHGSEFYIDGTVKHGPAPRPLHKRAIEVRNGDIYVGGIIS